MVVPLFDYSAVVWESCGQGSKSYLDKLNRRAACRIEAHADKSGELSTSLRSKRFQSSYCAKVRAEEFFFFCPCPSFLDEPREETLATQANFLPYLAGSISKLRVNLITFHYLS